MLRCHFRLADTECPLGTPPWAESCGLSNDEMGCSQTDLLKRHGYPVGECRQGAQLYFVPGHMCPPVPNGLIQLCMYKVVLGEEEALTKYLWTANGDWPLEKLGSHS